MGGCANLTSLDLSGEGGGGDVCGLRFDLMASSLARCSIVAVALLFDGCLFALIVRAAGADVFLRGHLNPAQFYPASPPTYFNALLTRQSTASARRGRVRLRRGCGARRR